MPNIDELIHQPSRLRIMAALVSLRAGEQIDFGFLKERFSLTDGNLGAHIRTLEEAGYILIEKTFVGRKPKTYILISPAGRKAFASHVAALNAILKTKG